MQRRRPLYSITGPRQDRLRMLSRLTHHRHCPRYHYSTRSGKLSRGLVALALSEQAPANLFGFASRILIICLFGFCVKSALGIEPFVGIAPLSERRREIILSSISFVKSSLPAAASPYAISFERPGRRGIIRACRFLSNRSHQPAGSASRLRIQVSSCDPSWFASRAFQIPSESVRSRVDPAPQPRSDYMCFRFVVKSIL